MRKILTAIVITILTSLYFFPFSPVWLPSANTKMVLAALAIPLFIIKGARLRDSSFNKGMLWLTICGFCVSIAGIIAVVANNTTDYTYASYFVSMWVWLGGAYTVVHLMHVAYEKVTIRLVGNFLIAVCVVQCILAQIINTNESVAAIVDTLVVSSGYMGIVDERLYGIGCALDVAGLRFCAVLLMTTFFALTPASRENKTLERSIYILAFLVISVFGSMIARTTSVGIVLCVILCMIFSLMNKDKMSRSNVRGLIRTFAMCLFVVLPVIILFYKINPDFKENLRFGFEGFFSLAEEGEWDVRSNRQLFSMVIWPDNFKTWIIGDGYFSQPQNDYYYVGPAYDYYMGTDVGYSRFIFYFGLLGLMAFSSVFVVSAIICSKRHPEYLLLFGMIMCMNFIGWVKAATDIFLVFAILLCIPKTDSEEDEHSMLISPDS